jgi:tetratricopeptide (TPR) repeat protein
MLKTVKKIKGFLYIVLTVIFLLTLSALAQSEKGIEYFNGYEFAKAEQVFSDVLKADPSNTEAGYYLGLSLYMQKKYAEALIVFKGIKDAKKEIPQNNGRLEIMITRICLELKKYPEALQMLEEAKAVKADQADIHVYQGAYYLETNEPQKAIKELEEAIKINPENAYAYFYAGYAYVRLGHPADGEKALKRFLELAPYAPEAEKVKILVDALC